MLAGREDPTLLVGALPVTCGVLEQVSQLLSLSLNCLIYEVDVLIRSYVPIF